MKMRQADRGQSERWSQKLNPGLQGSQFKLLIIAEGDKEMMIMKVFRIVHHSNPPLCQRTCACSLAPLRPWPLFSHTRYASLSKETTFCFLLKKIFLFLIFDFRQRESSEEREVEKCWGERETLIGCLPQMPQLGTEPATQACSPTRNWTRDLSVCGTMPNQLGHTDWGNMFCFLKEKMD